MLASWLRPETRPYWDTVDVFVFRALNNTLCLGELWQRIWAYGGCRKFDIVSGGVMFAFLLIGHREQSRLSVVQSIISSTLLVAMVLLTREVIGELLVSKYFEFHRPSPTLALEGGYRLSELIASPQAKDASPWSFPGDHGFILISIVLYIRYLGARETSNWAGLTAFVLLLPRLIAGAHWMTDIVIGSACMAIGAMGLLMATPLHDAVIAGVYRLRSRRESDGHRIRKKTSHESTSATSAARARQQIIGT